MSNEVTTRDGDAVPPPKGTGRAADIGTLIDDDLRPMAPPVVEPGARIGRYELIERLGSGAMGMVFAAHDPALDRRLALKVVRPERRGPRARQRLLREARALAQVGHPNVVTVNDVGTHGEIVYMAMELVEGQTLTDWLEVARRPSEVLALLSQAGQGLLALHRAGLVHRDFKPDNVLVTPDARALVADLGIVQAADEGSWHQSSVIVEGSHDGEPSTEESLGSDRLTRDGTMLGTPRYMAPEQFLMEPTDARTDQLAFCIVLWEALYRQHPFADETVNSLAMSMTMGNLRPPPRSRPVPKAVHEILVRGLRTSPDDRFESMDALLRALDDARHRQGRAWPWVSGLGIAGGCALVGVVAASSPLHQPPCDGEDRIAEAWSESSVRRVSEAFEATGLPMAQASRDQVVALLDEHRSAWVDAYATSCEAPPSPAVDRWRECLEDRRQRLAGLVGVLERADETLVLNASAAVLELEPPGDCAQAADRGPSGPAVDPQQRARIDDIDRRLHQAWALQSAGAPDRAALIARNLPTEAAALAHPPLLARTLLARGVLADAVGDEEAAIEDLQEAVSIASASRTDEVLARAATALVGLESSRRADVAAAERWSRHAEAAIERLGHPARLEARHLQAMARLRLNRGDFDDADALLVRARSLLQEAPVHDALELATIEWQRGRIAARRGRRAEAIAAFERARGPLESALGSEHPMVTDLLSSVQEVYREQGELEKARALDDQIFPILTAAYGPQHTSVAVAFARRGTLLAAEGRYDESLAALSRSLEIFENDLGHEHPRVAGILTNRGIIYGRMGRFAEAVADQRRVLRIAETFSPEGPRMAASLDNLGAALVDAGQAAEALPLHQRALTMWEGFEPGSTSVAISLTDQSRALRALGRPQDAVPLLERAIELLAASTFDPVELARARFELARCLRDASREPSRARTLAERARDAYLAEGERTASSLAEVEAWLAEETIG